MTKICLHLALSRPPFLFENMKKLAIHVLYSAEADTTPCIAVGIVHCCLFCSGSAVYQVQRVLTIICCCCYCCTTDLLLCDECVPMAAPSPPAQLCFANCAKYSYVLLFVQYTLHNCAGGDFVHQCVIKHITVLSQEDLDHPDTIFASACAVADASVCTYVHVQMQVFAHICTCSGSSTMEAVPGKI